MTTLAEIKAGHKLPANLGGTLPVEPEGAGEEEKAEEESGEGTGEGEED